MLHNFKADIEAEADGEPIEAVVIGEMGWPGFGNDERHAPGLARKGEVLTWAEAAPLLDYEYQVTYGSPDCQAIYVWTRTHRISMAEEDGVTRLSSMSRDSFPGPGVEPPEMVHM